MSVLKRRSRLVTFRVSNEEFDQLKRICVSSGSRSISDFARTAVLSQTRVATAPQALLTEDLATLTSQLADLDAELKRLRGRINRILGSVGDQENES
jgi:hypothetical protein